MAERDPCRRCGSRDQYHVCRPRAQVTRRCSICGSTFHNRRTCPAAGGTRRVRCTRCSSRAHMTADCPNLLIESMQREMETMREVIRTRVHLTWDSETRTQTVELIDDDSTEDEKEEKEENAVVPSARVNLEDYRVAKGLPADQKLFYAGGQGRDLLILEMQGPYGKDEAILHEGTFGEGEVAGILDLFTVDERGHLLRCLEEGGDIVEPQSADDCPICMEPCFDRYKLPKNLPCGHQVCLKCLSTLPACGGKCPLCRNRLE